MITLNLSKIVNKYKKKLENTIIMKRNILNIVIKQLNLIIYINLN